MINIINDNYKEYSDKISDRMDDYAYREKRYSLSFSLIIAYSDENIDFDKVKYLQRQTDELIILKDSLFCLVLDGACSDSAIKAAANIKSEFLNTSQNLFTGVVSSKDYFNHNEMIESLFNLLKYSLVNNAHNMIIGKDKTFYSITG